jgi:hypothetical protein
MGVGSLVFGLARIKIDSFEGSAQDLTAGFSAEQAEQLMSNLYVEAQLMEGGVPMGLPSRTIYSPHGGDSAAGGGHGMHAVLCRWNDVLTFRFDSASLPHFRSACALTMSLLAALIFHRPSRCGGSCRSDSWRRF